MIKDTLKKQQEIVYQALENAAKQNRIASAYLFSGPEGTMKHDAAILLAETIFCEKQEGLACEECNTCRRVREGIYGDLCILDGREKSISKEDVDAIQEKFSKTALENSEGKRVYIIENIENASVSAQNSMLKFLEEPGSGITAILTTDNIARILPTIVSRCIVLPFVPMSSEQYFEQAVALGINEKDAWLLAGMIRNESELQEFYDSEIYEKAVMMLQQFLNAEGLRREELLVDWEISYRMKDSDRQKDKAANMTLLESFFRLLAMFGRDVLKHDGRGPAWYHNAVIRAEGEPAEYVRLIDIATEGKNRVNKYNDLNLVMAQAFYRTGGLKI